MDGDSFGAWIVGYADFYNPTSEVIFVLLCIALAPMPLPRAVAWWMTRREDVGPPSFKLLLISPMLQHYSRRHHRTNSGTPL